jgi:hypothetical protein
MSNKIRKTKANKKHNVRSGHWGARLQQRWPNRRSWQPNLLRVGRCKRIMRGMLSDALRCDRLM